MFELTAENIANRLRDLYLDKSKLCALLENERRRCKELEFNWAEKIFEIIENVYKNEGLDFQVLYINNDVII